MISQEQVDKYKNAVINMAVVIIALVIAVNIYNGKTAEINSLKLKINEEEKKNLELEEIGRTEKKKGAYKKLFVKKEASEVMADINDIANAAGVSVLSVKPSQSDSTTDYSKDAFEIAVKARSYDILAKFINSLESFASVYMIDDMAVDSSEEFSKKGLTVTLRISSIAAN